MRHTNNSRQTRENEIIEFHHGDFLFMITRFKRINWKEYKGFEQYQYFLYAFDKRLEIPVRETSTKDVFATVVREGVYPTFENLMLNLDAILSEYILVDDSIFECLKRVEKLNPIYLDHNGKE